MLLIVDNYDSFTFNLVHLLGCFTPDIAVVRNDATSADAILEAGYDAIVLSPGPCTPSEAGVCLELVEKGAGRVPILGVCLGLQAIGQAFGGAVVRAPVPMHGKTSRVRHGGEGLFAGCPQDFTATRYHSLVVARDTCPDVLAITAETEDDGQIMAASHRTLPVHGVQFHPESILSEHGDTLVANFLGMAAAWRNA